MSKLDLITTQIEFHGDDIVNVLESNFLMHDAIWKLVKQYLNAKITVHTSERLEEYGPIEWSMSVTSPQGRKTFSVTQRTPTGSVSFQPG